MERSKKFMEKRRIRKQRNITTRNKKRGKKEKKLTKKRNLKNYLSSKEKLSQKWSYVLKKNQNKQIKSKQLQTRMLFSQNIYPNLLLLAG